MSSDASSSSAGGSRESLSSVSLATSLSSLKSGRESGTVVVYGEEGVWCEEEGVVCGEEVK